MTKDQTAGLISINVLFPKEAFQGKSEVSCMPL